MTDPIATSAHNFRLVREKLLEQMPELADDADCLLDTLEGCTDVMDQLAALARSAAHDEAMLEGLTQYQVKLADRRATLRTRADRKRRVVQNYMADLNIKKIQKPDITVSRRAVAPSLVITDEVMINDKWCRWKRELDKTAIKKALEAGEQVMGATLSNGSETLAIKV